MDSGSRYTNVRSPFPLSKKMSLLLFQTREVGLAVHCVPCRHGRCTCSASPAGAIMMCVFACFANRAFLERTFRGGRVCLFACPQIESGQTCGQFASHHIRRPRPLGALACCFPSTVSCRRRKSASRKRHVASRPPQQVIIECSLYW